RVIGLKHPKLEAARGRFLHLRQQLSTDTLALIAWMNVQVRQKTIVQPSVSDDRTLSLGSPNPLPRQNQFAVPCLHRRERVHMRQIRYVVSRQHMNLG